MSGTGKTPGQRAYEGMCAKAEAQAEFAADTIYQPWDRLEPWQHECWEAAAAAGAAPAHERAAELLAELNAVTADRDRLSGLLAEAVDPAAQDYDNAAEILRLRDLIRELLECTGLDDDEQREYLERAGIEVQS